MILNRPCLCELEITNQSQTSVSFNQESARACVNAAIQLLELMPDNPGAAPTYFRVPWWSVLHYTCQTASVLLLELVLDAQHHTEEETEGIVYSLKKALAYLWTMAKDSLSAYKAWRIVRQLTGELAFVQKFDISDVPPDAPKPETWTAGHETILVRSLGSPRTSKTSSQ